MYEYKHREWERLEIERKERLSSQCHQSRLDNLSLDTLVGLKRQDSTSLAVLCCSGEASIPRANHSAGMPNGALSHGSPLYFLLFLSEKVHCVLFRKRKTTARNLPHVLVLCSDRFGRRNLHGTCGVSALPADWSIQISSRLETFHLHLYQQNQTGVVHIPS